MVQDVSPVIGRRRECRQTPYNGALLKSVFWERKCWIIKGVIRRAGMGMGVDMVPGSSETSKVAGGERVGDG